MVNRFPNKEPARVATIQDVAREARVSKGTVSKYLSGRPYVAKSTGQRIAAAIRALDYQPSALAQSLSRRRSHTIGVIVPNLRNPFYPELITGIEDTVDDGGYTLLLATTDADAERESRIVRTMQQRRVDGVVMAAARARDPEVQRLRASGTNLVLAGRGLPDADVDAVVLDNRAGAGMAVRHLLEHGHRRIAHLGGPQDIIPFRHRLEGYSDALAQAAIVLDQAVVAMVGADPRAAEVAALLEAMMELDEPPTAVFTANDNIAMGVLSACQQRGWRVPDQLAIVGFDNVWIDNLFAVPLTSVDGRAADIGREASGLLTRRIEERLGSPDEPPADPVQIVLQPELVTRQSCGCSVTS
jgi:DNA-binding LacI/PurR family transcriptional regulator